MCYVAKLLEECRSRTIAFLDTVAADSKMRMFEYLVVLVWTALPTRSPFKCFLELCSITVIVQPQVYTYYCTSNCDVCGIQQRSCDHVFVQSMDLLYHPVFTPNCLPAIAEQGGVGFAATGV